MTIETPTHTPAVGRHTDPDALDFGLLGLEGHYTPTHRADPPADDRGYVAMTRLDHGRLETFALGGIDWAKAPRPRRRHRCWPQTYGFTGFLSYVERCPCGAIRDHPKGRWIERNTRTRD